MNTEPVFYQESGKLKPVGLILAIAAIIALTIGLGYIYTIVVMFVPIIYFNVLLTVGVGLALGFIVRFLSRLSHNRHPKSRLALAIGAGILTNYFQWVAFLLYAYDGASPFFSDYLANLPWITNPAGFFSAVGEINQFGLWEIFGIPFNGILLAIVWLIEFGIILVVPMLSVQNMKLVPYSENQGKWYPRYTLEEDFEGRFSKASVLEELQQNPLEFIKGLSDGNAWKHSKIHLYYLENEQHQYLDFERVMIEDMGKGKTNRELLVDNLRIDGTTARMIKHNFKNSKNRLPVV